ncbi:MAG TPA: hypothetical protein VKG38_10655 [Solirubrobacteraceae bacterium]|nr:hypothetical protein [Solirubrobacteraceae bacterium]
MPVSELEAERAATIASASGKAPDFSLELPSDGKLTPTEEWSRRVRRVGGLIQVAFAALWLVRGSAVIGGGVSAVLIAVSGAAVIGVLSYAIRVTAGTAPRPTSSEGKRIERDITVATVIELVAAFALPVLVVAAGHSDWVLPSIAITIGPLLLYLDRRVHIPRYRPVGWLLTIGPVILVATMSGTPLVVTTGIASGVLLLGTAAAGFHDLAGVRSRATQAASRKVGAATKGARP